MANVDGSRASDNQRSYTACEFQCDPCARSGSVKEASTYCKQCGEYMCVTCASMHSGLKVTRNHTMVSGSDLALTGQSGTKKLSLSFCDRHGNKTIEWFCKKHEAMFCNACKITKHRKCEVIVVSDKSASECGQSLTDVIGSMESLKCRIENFKAAREKSAEDLANFRKSCESAVVQFKSTIIENVKRLEKKMLADIDNVVTTETDFIQDHVNACDSLIHDVDTELITADEAKKAADDVTSVIAAHKLSKLLKTHEPTVYGLEQEVYDVHITFQPSRQLTDVFSEFDQLGILEIDRIETAGTDPPEYLASRSACPVSGRKSWLEMEVVSSTDINVQSTDITDSAIMPDGRLILADYSNKQIILLDRDFNIQSTLGLPGKPLDLAVYGDNAVILTLWDMKQLKYIHVDRTLRAGYTIQTELNCWGVAVHDDEIYVNVFDGQYGNHVQVLDTRGTVIRRIGMGVHGKCMYTDPGCITVGTGGTLYHTSPGVFVTGYIMCHTNVGDVVYDVQLVGGPRGMLADEEGNLLVCCYWSNTIQILGKDGACNKVILSSADGVVSPHSVSHRRSDQTLIVTMRNNPSCRAFKLK